MKREKSDRETLIQDLLPETDSGEVYSLEDILSEFSGDWDADDAAQTVSAAGETGTADGDSFLTDFDFEYELAARQKMPSSRQVATKSAEESITEAAEGAFSPKTEAAEMPVVDLTEENEGRDQRPETASEEKAAKPASADYKAMKHDGENEAPSRSRRLRIRKTQKVVEEFPEPSAGEALPAEENIDYTALFRMFAEPESETQTAESGEEKTAAEAPANGRNETDRTAAEPPKQKEEPLLAENPVDFRDILREFMLGDQHPIYADMPGIGKKAEPDSKAAEDLSELDALLSDVIRKNSAPEPERKSERESVNTEVPAPEPEPERTDAGTKDEDVPRKAGAASGWRSRLKLNLRPKARAKQPVKPEPEEKPIREYTVEEDFPEELPEKLETEKEDDWEELNNESAGSDTVSESSSETQDNLQTDTGLRASEESEETDTEKAEPDSLRKKLLQGFTGRNSTKKRALNEPKAYASFEDYVPDEGKQPENTEQEEKPKANLPGEEDERTEQPELKASEAETEEEDDEILYSGDFPSFGQWILNELMTVWIRLNGIGDRESTATMEDDSEELGREVNVANASRYYGSQVTMLRMRFQIGLVVIAILAYITLGLPVSGMLKTAKVSSAMCLGLQLTIMLLCLDVVTNAAVNLIRRKFGADALAVLACVISSLDALSVSVGGFGTPHIPLCLFSSLALMGILLSSLLSSRALRKSTRVPAIGKRVYCVTAEEGVRANGDLTLLKSVRPSAGFVRRAEEAPPDESLFARSASVQLLAAVLLSLLTALFKHSLGDMLYILSAILSCAVPVTALLAFALPFFIGSERIFSSGAAVAGWSGIHDIGCSRNLIVTDRDLFPEDTVAIETVRIFADDSAERVIGFAGSMIAASGSGLAPCFAELMVKNNCRMRQVEDFQWLSGGGLQGRIEGSTVLCGNSDLMQLMNVKVPYRLVDRTTVLLAIDGVLYGIFKINYTGLPEIRTALQELIASNRHPIFAIRDFNITPDMLHEVFDVATDGYDFPPYGDRFRISEAKPSETSKISAVICREGLGPLTHLADTGRSMYVAIRMNLIITAAVAVLGMLLVFVKLIGTGELSAWLPFVLMLLDAITVTLISLFMRF